MSQENPAVTNRPTRFEEVKGQERAVDFLSGLIRRGQRRRDILLHGAVGSGKTTLAYIYARGLNCDRPDPKSGSPCGTCPWCQGPPDDYLIDHDVAGREADGGAIKALLAAFRSWSLPPGKTKVLFLDEAHRLEPAGSDALLKAIEDRAENEVYIVATSEHERLRASLVSRLIPVEVHALSLELARDVLAAEAARRNLIVDPDALDLLAGLTPGSPRNLVNSLERFDDENRRVDLPRVKFLLNVQHIDLVPDYLLEIARGDVIGQNRVLARWRETPRRRVTWIRTVLTSIFYTDLLALDVSFHPSVAAISAGTRSTIVRAFGERFKSPTAGEMLPKWRRMMRHWQLFSDNPTSAEFAARCTEFAMLVSDIAEEQMSPGVADAQMPSRASSGLGFGVRPPLPLEVEARRPRSRLFPLKGFLSDVDVRQVYNAASFLMQEYGESFDLHLTLETTRPGNLHPNLVVTEADRRWDSMIAESFEHDAHFIRVAERHGDAVTINTVLDSGILSSDPAEGHSAPLRRLANGLASQWAASFPAGTTTTSRVSIAQGGRSDRLKFHWKAVRALCEALDGEYEDYDPGANRWVSLRRLIGLRSSPKSPAQPLGVPLVKTSRSLTERAIGLNSALDLAPISAFDHRAWKHLHTGWELSEHQDRLATRWQRTQELQSYRDAQEPAHGQAAHTAHWIKDPLARRRSTLGWWSDVRFGGV